MARLQSERAGFQQVHGILISVAKVVAHARPERERAPDRRGPREREVRRGAAREVGGAKVRARVPAPAKAEAEAGLERRGREQGVGEAGVA